MAKRLSNSNWFITINTNQRFANYEQAKPLLLALQRAVRDVFQHLSEYVEIKREGDSWSPDFINQVKVRQGVEFSEDRGLAHVHFMIAIKHKTRIHLDYAKIQSYVRESLARSCPQCFRDGDGKPKTLYFYSRVYRDAQANFEDYIDKDEAARNQLLK